MPRETSKDRTALVTGSSAGIGLLTCLALARRGYRVVAAMRKRENGGRLLQAAAEAGVGDRITCVEWDVTDFDRAREVVDAAIRHGGAIDVLVNNAGYACGGFVEEVPLAAWRQQFDTNVFGAIAATRAVLPHMRERRTGTIINVSSISGRIGFPALGPYVASKFALEGFSESLRLEMLPFGVYVVLVEPGSYRTDIWQKGMKEIGIRPDSPYAGWLESISRRVRRTEETAGDPREVAELIAAVASTPAPRFRYPVGKGVKAAIRLRDWLPWAWWERLIAKNANMPK